MSFFFSFRPETWMRCLCLGGLFLLTAFYDHPIMANYNDHQEHFENEGHKYVQSLKIRAKLLKIIKEHPEALNIKGIADILEHLNALAKEFQQYGKLRGLAPRELIQTIKQPTTPVKSGNEPTPFIEGEEEIDPTSFVNACLQWRKTMNSLFKKKSKELANVQINLKSFSENLDENQSTLPIVQALYEEWGVVLDTLQQQGDTTTGEQLFVALMQQSGPAWTMTNDPNALKEHYKARGHRSIYKKINGDAMGFQLGLLPKSSIFTDALEFSISKDDPNLLENQQEAQEDEAAAIKEMKQKWERWLNQTLLPALAEIDTATERKLIDIPLLIKGQQTYIQYPSYAQAFCEATAAAIVENVKAAAGTLSYNQVVNITVSELRLQFNHFVTDEFLQQAIKSGEQDLPIGFKRWLVSSIDQNDALFTAFTQGCQEWASSVKGLVGEAEAANNNRAFKIVQESWKAQLETLFRGDAVPLFDAFANALPAQKVLDLPTVQAAWISALTTIQNEDFLDALWLEQLLQTEEGNIEQAIMAFKTNLPTLQTLGQGLIDARYTAPKEEPRELVQQAQTDTVETRLAITWNEVGVLITSGMQGISEEVGIESAVEELVGWLPGNWDVNTTAGLGSLRLRTTEPTELDLRLPLQLQQQNDGVIAVPQKLDNSVVKFVANNDNHYDITVQSVKINNKPKRQGNQVRQEIVLGIQITDPQLSIAFSTSAGVASVDAAVSKNPSKTSVDLVFTLVQTQDQAANQIAINFVEVRLVTENELIQNIQLSSSPVRQLTVFE